MPHSLSGLAWLLALACLPLSFLDFFFSRVQISSAATTILRSVSVGRPQWLSPYSVATRSIRSTRSVSRLSPLSRCRPGCPAASKYPIVQCESVSFCLSGKFCVRVLGFCNFAFFCSFTSLLCWLPTCLVSWTFHFCVLIISLCIVN